MTCACWSEPVLSERERKESERDRQRLLVEWWERKEDWGGLLLVYNLKTTKKLELMCQMYKREEGVNHEVVGVWFQI